MTTPNASIIRMSRRYPFSAERVFDAWLNPELAARWLFTTAFTKNTRAEVDPRVGGRFTFTDSREGEDIEHTGTYLEIARPSRLVFSFGVPKYSPDFDRVTVEITPLPDGCELHLTHEMKPEWMAYAGETQDGWVQLLEGLAASLGDARAATNRAPGKFTAPGEVQFVRLLPGPIERVWAYLVEGKKRKKWLAGGGLEEKVGGTVELFFRHQEIAPHETPPEKYHREHFTGFTLPGTVTRCEPPRLLSYTWGGDDSPGISEVTFALEPKGGEVELTLTHRRLGEDRAMTACVSAGWHTHLNLLIALLGDAPSPGFWIPFSKREPLYAARLG